MALSHHKMTLGDLLNRKLALGLDIKTRQKQCL